MNSNIKVMVELQMYWDKALSARASIEKLQASVKAMEKDLAAAKSRFESMSKTAKELKNSIKLDELSLSEMSARITKLEERKKIIQTEKELKALEKEIDVIGFETGNLEEKALAMIDELDAKERVLSGLQSEIDEKTGKLEDEKAKTSADVAARESIMKENNDRFDALIDQLSALYKSKFLKMINARDGKAIARVEGEICGFCNFKIPSFLAIEASKDDKVVNCTNCGKYIYK